MPILTAGVPLDKARVAVVMIHGRGASAADMFGLAGEFGPAFDHTVAYVAPEAARSEWYPYRFMDVTDPNEPYLISALNKVRAALDQVAAAGIPLSRTILLGFSQGACLTLEYTARYAPRCAAAIALSGGLIGKTLDQARYQPALDGLPVFLGCSDIDFHIPLTRVQESSAIFRTLGATVTERIYPGMGHTVNMNEVEFIRNLLAAAAAAL
jgi:predicted esterase